MGGGFAPPKPQSVQNSSTRMRSETPPLIQQPEVLTALLSAGLPLNVLARLTLVSKVLHVETQPVLETSWLEALMSIKGFGEDPVGRHANVPGFPISVFTTVNNLPKSQGMISLLLPERLHHRIDDVIRALGCGNIVQTKHGDQACTRKEAAKTLARIVAQQQKRPELMLNIVVEGKQWDNLLQNGMRPELMFKKNSNARTPMWDALGVPCHRCEDPNKPTNSEMLQATSDGSHVRLVRIVHGATPKAVAEESICPHWSLCIRTDKHTKKTCVLMRNAMDGGNVIGYLGISCIGHMSSTRTLGLNQAFLNEANARAIRRLLLGIYPKDDLTFYMPSVRHTPPVRFIHMPLARSC